MVLSGAWLTEYAQSCVGLKYIKNLPRTLYMCIHGALAQRWIAFLPLRSARALVNKECNQAYSTSHASWHTLGRHLIQLRNQAAWPWSFSPCWVKAGGYQSLYPTSDLLYKQKLLLLCQGSVRLACVWCSEWLCSLSSSMEDQLFPLASLLTRWILF